MSRARSYHPRDKWPFRKKRKESGRDRDEIWRTNWPVALDGRTWIYGIHSHLTRISRARERREDGDAECGLIEREARDVSRISRHSSFRASRPRDLPASASCPSPPPFPSSPTMTFLLPSACLRSRPQREQKSTLRVSRSMTHGNGEEECTLCIAPLSASPFRMPDSIGPNRSQLQTRTRRKKISLRRHVRRVGVMRAIKEPAGDSNACPSSSPALLNCLRICATNFVD